MSCGESSALKISGAWHAHRFGKADAHETWQSELEVGCNAYVSSLASPEGYEIITYALIAPEIPTKAAS